MKKVICKPFIVALLLVLPLCYLSAQQTAKKILHQQFNLIPLPAKDTQYYEMESTLQKHALDGTIQGTDVYRLFLRCVPAAANSSKGDEYTCLRFTVKIDTAPEVSIPSLANWKYYFSLSGDPGDKKGEVLGIDHSKFEKLSNQDGKSLAVENTYHVYNAFIDFHTMSVFAEKTANDSGVQKLKYIGDKIVHAASFSQPKVSSGSNIGEGSYFKNGEITLSFKGLGLVNDKSCAIIEYDSGKSSFYMLVKPMPTMEVPTKGSSHYWGDIYKDLAGGWIQKAVLHELVVSETTVPGLSNKINSVIERSILIKNVNRF